MEWFNRENPLCIKTDMAIKASQVLFFLTYAMYLIFKTAVNTTYKYDHSTELLNQGVWICCFLALLSVIFLCRYTIGQLLGILLLFGLYFFIWGNTQWQDFGTLQSLLIIFSCRHVQWEKLLKFSFITYIPLILIPAFLEQIGILPDVAIYRATEQRYTLGFSHPNVLGGYCLCFVIIWLLIRYERIKIYDYIAWLLIAAFLWLIPNSKASTFLVLLLCLFTFVSKHWGKTLIKSRIVQSLCLSFGWLMAGFSILASYFYDSTNDLYVTIDKTLFTTRLSCAHTFLTEYPITFFGQKLTLVSSVTAKSKGIQSHILDNFYVRQLMNLGVISFLAVLLMFTYLMYKAISTRNFAQMICMIAILIYCVYENRGTNLVYNILLFQIVYQVIARRGDYYYDQSISNRTSL